MNMIICLELNFAYVVYVESFTYSIYGLETLIKSKGTRDLSVS